MKTLEETAKSNKKSHFKKSGFVTPEGFKLYGYMANYQNNNI